MTHPHPSPIPSFRPARPLVLLLAVLVLGGCASLLSRTPPPRYGQQRLYYEVRRTLNVAEPSPAYYRQRARLEVMGKELDEVLIRIVEDASEEPNVRANAVVLLADRRAWGAVDLLRRVLLSSSTDDVRAAAITGLSRFAADTPGVRNAVRAALGDPSTRVRLGALQALDVEDAPRIRRLLRVEEDAQVRTVAQQLLTLFEGRGAPLALEGRGLYRTAGGDTVAQIVFQPARRDTAAGVDEGALWVELPGASLVPLAQVVEVVEGVVPAFFNTNRDAVVFEAEREIRVRELRSGQLRTVAPGLAPRVIPFTDRFVFVREVPGSRRPGAGGGGTSVEYAVLRADFAGGAPEEIGTLRAVFRPRQNQGASPVRRMVIGEVRDGFVLRGPGIAPFVLPGTFEGPRP